MKNLDYIYRSKLDGFYYTGRGGVINIYQATKFTNKVELDTNYPGMSQYEKVDFNQELRRVKLIQLSNKIKYGNGL